MTPRIPEPEHLLALTQWCLNQSELVENFNRLYGCSVGQSLSPISQLIDDATGKTEADLKSFIGFVKEVFWDRLPEECFEVTA